MKKMNMLFISNHQEALTGLNDTVLNVTAVHEAETAVEKLHQTSFDLITIDNTIINSEMAMLQTIIELQQPEASVIVFENREQLNTLVNEWIKKEDEQHKPSYSFIDNGFSNHFLYANDNNG